MLYIVRHFLVNKAGIFKPNTCVVFPYHINTFMRSGNRFIRKKDYDNIFVNGILATDTIRQLEFILSYQMTDMHVCIQFVAILLANLTNISNSNS